MPNHTLQILRLLRFAGLMLLLGSVALASAQTVGERAKNDPSFRIYPVVFGVTATTNSKPPVVRVVEIGTPVSERSKSGKPPKIDVPEAFIKAAKKKIQAEPAKPQMKDGKPVEIFTYFFYVPGIPMSWSLTWTSRSTSNHDIQALCRLAAILSRLASA
jgi:hypothetical protein